MSKLHYQLFLVIFAFLSACGVRAVPEDQISGSSASVSPEQATDLARARTEPASQSPQIEACSENSYVSLCIQDVSVNEHGIGISVLIKSDVERVMPSIPFAPPVPEQGIVTGVYLLDSSSVKHEYLPALGPWPGDVPGDGNVAEQLFTFEYDQPATGSYILHIPAVVLIAEVNADVSLDLGSRPVAGSAIPMEAFLPVMGRNIVFSHAEVDDLLNLHVISDPIDSGQGVTIRWLNAGLPHGWTSGTGPGDKYDFGAHVHDVWFPLVNADGTENSGLASFHIYDAVIYISGPFLLHFQVN